MAKNVEQSVKPAKRRRRIVLRVVGGVLGLLVLLEGVGLLLVLRQSVEYPRYWAARAEEPAPAEAIRVVAYGDSSAMGIGAWRPEDSLVGRIVRHVADQTGRPVQVINHSSGGGGLAEVLERVTESELAAADLIIVTAGSGDAAMPIDVFERRWRDLARSLPADRTVISGIPPGRDWEARQAVLAKAADDAGIGHADVAGEFLRAQRLDIFAPDFTHVNSTGYWLWFRAFQPHIDEVLARR